MSMIETAVRGAQKLEMILEKRLGATGRGLHEKLTSVERRVSQDVMRQARWVATLRNKVVHEGATIPDVARFERVVEELARKLEAIPAASSPSPPARAQGPRFQSAAVEDEDDDEDFQSARGLRSHRRKVSRLELVAVLGVVAFVGYSTLGSLMRSRSSRSTAEAAERERSKPLKPLVATPPPAAQQAPPRATPIKAEPAAGKRLVALPKEAAANLAAAKQDIDENVWGYLQRHTELSLGEPELKDNGDGTHELRVSVGWSVDHQPLVETLNKYFWGSSKSPLQAHGVDSSSRRGSDTPGIVIQQVWNAKERQKVPFSNDLLLYLAAKQARIRVTAGSYSGTLTIASGRACFSSCTGVGTDQFQLHVNNREKPERTLFSSYVEEQNPLLVGRIKNEDLDSIGLPSAVVEIVPASP